MRHLKQRIQSWASTIKRHAITLWFVARDPEVPWKAKALCWAVVLYALSPIDLIPDFIPVLGWLDDMVILPALIWLALKLIPAERLNVAKKQADCWRNNHSGKLRLRAGVIVVVLIWLLIGAGAAVIAL
jgi:uncharacterized membrane protein YkvA (DUF1232 family)